MKFTGKVAFITGAAQGQGSSHAVRLAAEGADVIALDICRQLDCVPYQMGDETGLEETIRQVEAHGRRIHAVKADVRDAGAVEAAVAEGVRKFGRLDIVAANASICTVQPHDG